MSSRISPQDVLNALRAVKDPDLGRDIVTLGFIKELEVGDSRVSFALQLTTPACPVRDQLVAQARAAVMALGVADVEVRLVAPAPARSPGHSLIPQVKYTIAVASGKGGVGKSTVAANLAVALHRAGAKVGLMDTDVYGPSVPILMGGNDAPYVVEGKIEPPVEYGIKIMSMAFFLPKDEAVIWRGPMLHKTIQQFLGDVRWGELDYLIMDMPPGTGDIQLSLSPEHSAHGRGDCLHAAGSGAERGVQSHRHVSKVERADPRHRGKHELLPVPAVRPPRRNLRPRRRARSREEAQLRVPGRNSARLVDSRAKRFRQAGGARRLDDLRQSLPGSRRSAGGANQYRKF